MRIEQLPNGQFKCTGFFNNTNIKELNELELTFENLNQIALFGNDILTKLDKYIKTNIGNDLTIDIVHTIAFIDTPENRELVKEYQKLNPTPREIRDFLNFKRENTEKRFSITKEEAKKIVLDIQKGTWKFLPTLLEEIRRQFPEIES